MINIDPYCEREREIEGERERTERRGVCMCSNSDKYIVERVGAQTVLFFLQTK